MLIQRQMPAVSLLNQAGGTYSAKMIATSSKSKLCTGMGDGLYLNKGMMTTGKIICI